MIKSLEHLSHEQAEGVQFLEEKAQGEHLHVCKYLTGRCKKMESVFSQWYPRKVKKTIDTN